jgi:hypothetical protein
MLRMFRRRLNSTTLQFDEEYCHSAGKPAKTYKFPMGTNEIVFKFQNFQNFMNTYFHNNAFLPASVKEAVNGETAFFCAQLVEAGLGTFLCRDDVNAEGEIVFRPGRLKPLRGHDPLREFSRGILAFGVHQPDAALSMPPPSTFHVLWATRYEAAQARSGA